MATNAAFRNFLQDQVVGLNTKTAREVVDVHGINRISAIGRYIDQQSHDVVEYLARDR